jgi:hypothetical protein
MRKSHNNFADGFPDPLSPQFSGGRFSLYFARKASSWRARLDKIRAQQPVRISATPSVHIVTQINHIKNITSLFSHEWLASFVCSSSADAPDGACWVINDGLLTGERSSASPISSALKSVTRRRAKSRARVVEVGQCPINVMQ